MAENQATPPLTAEAITGLIAAALKPVTEALGALATNQKVIADTMANDAKAKADEAAAKTAAAASPTSTPTATATTAAGQRRLTAEAVAKLLNDTLAARDQVAQGAAARNSFIADKLKGVPAAYHGKLGNDPSKWPAEEQAIRENFKADLQSLGLKAPDVSGGAGAGAAGGTPSPEAAAKASLARNLTPGQAKFAESLKLPAA